VQKYSQLQQASSLAQQKGADELIQTLSNYYKIFTELDAEYEKYFNDLVDRNLRVDYNIKNSFGPHLPQRLHSF
jgi:hypothetical protein